MGCFPRGGITNVSSVSSGLKANELFSILVRVRGETRLKHNCWKFREDRKHTHTQQPGEDGVTTGHRALFIGIITPPIKW